MHGRGVGAMFWLTTVDAPRLSIYVKVIARDRSLNNLVPGVYRVVWNLVQLFGDNNTLDSIPHGKHLELGR